MRRVLWLLAFMVLASYGIVFSHPAGAQVTPDNFEVMLAVDTSGSMKPAMDQAKAAAVGFINQMPANVRIGLVDFGKQVTVDAPPTTDRAALTDRINALSADGETPLYDGVITAVNAFTPSAANKALVLLSDGKDTLSAHGLDEAVASVKGDHVEAISLTTADTDIPALQALGTVTPADDPTGLSASFGRVADLLTKVVATTPTTVVPPPTTAFSRVPAPTTVTGTTSDSATQSWLWLGALGVGAALFILVWSFWPRQRVSKARLGIQQPRNVSEMGKRTVTAVEEFLERHGKRGTLAQNLSVASISMQPGEFIVLVFAIALVTGLVGMFLAGPLLGVLLGGAVCLIARAVVKRRLVKRQTQFAQELPEVLQLLTTSLRSGLGITQALDSVAEEADEPARSEFAHVLVETRLGRDLSDALRSLSQRMQSEDLDWVVGAIEINRDTGGNLTETLTQVSETIRERQRMVREVQTLTAEGRLSGRILTAFPIIFALFEWKVNPDNFAVLTNGSGILWLVAGAVLMLIGWLWINRIVKGVAL